MRYDNAEYIGDLRAAWMITYHIGQISSIIADLDRTSYVSAATDLHGQAHVVL